MMVKLKYISYVVRILLLCYSLLYIVGIIHIIEYYLHDGHWASCTWYTCHDFCPVVYDIGFSTTEQFSILIVGVVILCVTAIITVGMLSLVVQFIHDLFLNISKIPIPWRTTN